MPVIFRPWIGELYFSQNPKILVLGESHYLKQNEQDLENFTIRVVSDLRLPGNKKIRFFTTVAKILSGQPYQYLSDEKSQEFWHRVAFYNFIQSSVGNGARIRPTEEMWLNSEAPFNIVINDLQPDIIVILGRELGSKIKYLESSHKNCFFCYWTHPSTPKYFNKQDAINNFNAAISFHVSKDWPI